MALPSKALAAGAVEDGEGARQGGMARLLLGSDQSLPLPAGASAGGIWSLQSICLAVGLVPDVFPAGGWRGCTMQAGKDARFAFA